LPISKYGTTSERKLGQPGSHASDNTIPRLTEHLFLETSATNEGKTKITEKKHIKRD
jgi:hypothetical protein